MGKIYLSLLLSALGCSGVCAGSAAGPGPEKAARELSARITGKPSGLPEIFDRSFFRNVSLERLTGLLAGIYRDNGAVSGTVLVSSSAGSGHFFFDTELGYRVPAALSLSQETGRINGLFFGAVYRKNASLKQVREKLAALPGHAGLLVRRLGEKPENLETLEENAYFNVGPAVTLYTLGALLKEGVAWEKVFRLKKGDKGLTDGRLRGWPDGAPLTAHTLAALMISENDGAAADALLSALGRRTIEDDLAALGHSAPGRLRPLLKTSELFRLRSDTESALKYLNLPLAERYFFLSALSGAPPAADNSAKSPFGTEKLAWTASPADLCRVMEYFWEKEDGEALEILALNPGPVIAGGNFLYAGYKGGSEPGALSAAWLLKTGRSDWFCLSASWNNGAESLNEAEFFGPLGAAVNSLAGAE